MRPLDPRLLRRSRTVRGFLAACIALGVLTAGLLVAQAWLLAAVVDALFTGDTVLVVAAGLAAVVAVRGLVAWATSTTSARASVAVRTGLRHDLLDHLLDPRRVGQVPQSARFSALLGGGLDKLDGYVARFLPQVVLVGIVPAVVVVALAVADVLTAVIVVLTVPLVVVFLVLVGLVTRDRLDRRWGELGRLGRHFSDVLDGIVVLKSFGRDQERGLRESGQRHRRATMTSLRTAFLSSLVLELFSTLSVALVAVSTGLRLVAGDLDLMTGLFVIVLAPEAYLPLRRLGASFHDSVDGATVAQEAMDLLESGRTSGWAAVPDDADIVLENVEVTHTGRTRPALRVPHDVIRPGEFVAVTGPSGSGKSTLLAVLLGFVQPTAGQVRVGAFELDQLDVEAWRRGIAWVPQRPGLLAGTIADNVRLGDPAADDAAVLAALRDAGADDLVPDREVDEAGSSLSAGERRRVGIARALLRVRAGAVRLLLLDEPTAGLDERRESAVLGVLCALHVTVVVVSHRPEAVHVAGREIRLQAPTPVSGGRVQS
ncbi:thiol reductant ABC exporter subunit CydD [Aeromicrobium sp. CTD01-1L150]|uniref:thiol reductant ABC exporter subunit CydD n=1 Tax=Aeromicrobium sp. CTD01-1L150 TaxID=3341830 RepID=UPI0035BEF204